MHATKRPRTLLLGSRSLPCSSADAATSLDAAVAHKTNAEHSLAPPPTPCTPPNDHELCCWGAAACHARARTPPLASTLL
ncbi:hypothetical protein PF007_g26531 [Phytophthora fragariae]|uniref:Uncharacterized protein n=1 Tax=Phytophthora fragariae TaxID=53985 RepID=A0A6A3Q968_9STRA|nr:hypothetical protein PF003_g29808 [Phytophthora fragariae]KAE8885999.1 hypothetical protein PF003_g29804 [Phytophthora fragariae]KAE9071508.1 hypothetical protein PF007_g26531 [Phytophthora fragariae]KAE9254999.1 hypothetical protein PF001_g33393 [Phytophthora fragariae]